MLNNKIPYLNISAQNKEIRDSLLTVFEEILDSGNYISGAHVAKFESSFSSVLQVPFAVACNTGTSALILSLQALGIQPGDEVLVPGMTFIATIEAVVAAGGVPVLIDVDARTWNLDVKLAKEKITPKTKAMIFVHLHGNPAGILDARKFCNENGLLLVEDAAQAHLAEVDGKMVGSFGDVAAFSFYPGKNLGALGEGGCLSTASSTVYEKAKMIRNWGSQHKYVHEIRGTNYRMDEIQAAFLDIKLKELERWTSHRENLSKLYNTFFDSLKIVRPFTMEGTRHSFHIYAILVNDRDSLRKHLLENSIETGIHYPAAITKMEPWIEYFSQISNCPVSENLSMEFLSLPLSDQHTTDDVTRVINVVGDFFALNPRKSA
jgi:dTDP-4-amino-4,6-dideoxygalactose transaminase